MLIDRILPVSAWDGLLNRSRMPMPLRIKAFCRLDPAFLEALGRRKSLALFHKAAAAVPAYAEFLRERGVDPKRVRTFADFERLVPVIDKESYVKRYPLAARCLGGALPLRGLLEESSGTCSAPTNWARSAREEEYPHALNRLTMSYLFGFHRDPTPIVFINANTLGAWAGGQRFASRMAPLGLVKNIGPDAVKVLQALADFGPSFRYLISGYPPFLKDLVDRGTDQSGFDWSRFRVDILTGGEGFVEGWRDYLRSRLGAACRIYSIYGAIDLDVGIATETPLSVSLKRILTDDSVFRQEFLGSERIPCYVGQYSPANFLIRNSGDGGELEITELNRYAAAPKIRYNIKDDGGSLSFAAVEAFLSARGLRSAEIADQTAVAPVAPLAFVYLFGRADGTVFFNGAMISPTDIEQAVFSDRFLSAAVHAFQLAVESDERHSMRLKIYLETQDDPIPAGDLAARGASTIVANLVKANECYRHAFEKDPRSSRPDIVVVPFGTGPFGPEEDRVKRRYITGSTLKATLRP